MRFLLLLKSYFVGNFWSIPTLIAATVLALVPTLIILDGLVIASPDPSAVQVQSINTGLYTLLGAMVTVFGVALPLTFSLLTRTASQFSPMVLRIVRSQAAFKVLIGFLLGVVLYLVALICYGAYQASTGVPLLAAVAAALLALVAFCIMPLMFDRLTRQMQPSYLASALANDLKSMLLDLELIEEEQRMGQLEVKQDREGWLDRNDGKPVTSTRTGYVIDIDYPGLVEQLHSHKLKGRVTARAGDFVVEGEPLIYLEGVSKEQSAELAALLQSQFEIKTSRASISDLELQLDELVSIAVKALSPAVNSLATAIQCLDQIEECLRIVINRSFPSGEHRDDQNTLRLHSRQFDFEGFVHAAFDCIRQNGTSQPALVIRVLQIIEKLLPHCRSEGRTKLLQETAQEFCPFDLKERYSQRDYEDTKQILDRIMDNGE